MREVRNRQAVMIADLDVLFLLAVHSVIVSFSLNSNQIKGKQLIRLIVEQINDKYLVKKQ